jgi:hypothetical protein
VPKGDIDEPPLLGPIIRDNRATTGFGPSAYPGVSRAARSITDFAQVRHGAIGGKASAPKRWESIFAKIGYYFGGRLSGLWRLVVRVAAASPFSGENYGDAQGPG